MFDVPTHTLHTISRAHGEMEMNLMRDGSLGVARMIWRATETERQMRISSSVSYQIRCILRLWQTFSRFASDPSVRYEVKFDGTNVLQYSENLRKSQHLPLDETPPI
jgi:hypothetical protein